MNLPLPNYIIQLKHFLQKHSRLLISLLLTLFSCRIHFVEIFLNSTDGSWTWALTEAVSQKQVFGRDFVFTYGPLGFLSTRYIGNISKIYLLLGDLVLFLATFNLLFRSVNLFRKEWILPLFFSVIIFRSASYSQAAFIYFIIYVVLCLSSDTNKNRNLIFCAVLGTILFFVKINHGIISLALVLGVAATLARKHIKSSILLLSTTLLLGTFLYSVSNITLSGYIEYSLPLITDYDEAMFVPINPGSYSYNFAMLFLALMTIPVGASIYKVIRSKESTSKTLYAVPIIAIVCFLLYKNGFTRFDRVHYEQFYFGFPFFYIITAFLLREQNRKTVIVSAYCMVAISAWSLTDFSELANNNLLKELSNRISIGRYYGEVFAKVPPTELHYDKLPDWQIEKVKGSSVDLIPRDIGKIPKSNLKYAPRPILQSYSVYSPELDSLNGYHFLKKNRPDYIFIQHDGIDDRYQFWNESFTKAVLSLNYEFVDDTPALEPLKFLLLKHQPGSGSLPSFTKIKEETCRMGDSVIIPNDSLPIYLTADIRYTTTGLINKLLFQPPGIEMTLITEDGFWRNYRMIVPIVKTPVPVSNLVTNYYELRNFFTGNIAQNIKIKYIIINTHNSGVIPEINISFYRFDNYR